MSKKNIVVLAAKYPDADHAQTILTMLESMNHALTIDLDDAVMLTRELDGKIKTRLLSSGGDMREPTWGPFNREKS